MSILENCEPKEPLKYFEQLCQIPHGSGDTKKISDFCVDFAKSLGLWVSQDDLNNVIIKKPGTKGYEDKAPVILQGHMDMVCEKTPESPMDFSKDGLSLETDGKFLWAKDTTLGGDDGIAIAMAMAVLASKDIAHPPIEAVFTVDEEIGLLGASGMDLSALEAKQMINIDSEAEGIITVGCAGGLRLDGRIPVCYEEKQGTIYNIALTGLIGGHSGTEINKCQGNSNVLMGRVLETLNQSLDVDFCKVSGGSKDNVIARHTVAAILVDTDKAADLEAALEAVSKELQAEYTPADKDMHIEYTKEGEGACMVLTKDSSKIVRQALMNLPNGIQAMSADIPGLVETSLNMGAAQLDDKELLVRFAIRSSKESAKKYLTARTKAMIQYLGGTSTESGSYPGWAYRADSKLRDTFVEVYTKQYGQEPKIEAIHAGLECGLFSDKIKDLDCVSIGPDIHDIHTYEEKLDLASTERTWKLLLGVLKSL